MWTETERMRSTDKADINFKKIRTVTEQQTCSPKVLIKSKWRTLIAEIEKNARKIKLKRSENSKEERGKPAIHENIEGPEILNPENMNSIKAAMLDGIIIKILLPLNDSLKLQK